MSTASLTSHTALRVNGTRLWNSLMQLAQIGATPKGGVCRLALTDLDREGRDFFVGEAQAAGCTIRIDCVGNIFARRAGRDDSLPAILTGSHIDTQPTGGKFDGNYGVLAGLEVFKTLNDAKITTDAPLEVVVWTNEEGSRFVPVMMGSGAFIGEFKTDFILAQKDRDGITVGQALNAIGYAGTSQVSPRGIGAYFEAHIEQGPVLEAHDITIGVVTGALGQRWFDVVITGSEAHAGPTPMQLRHDALLAASHLVQLVNELALDHAPHARGTVGMLDVYPNSRNVIPGTVKMSVDLRADSDATLTEMVDKLNARAQVIAKQGKVSVALTQVVYFPPAAFAPELVQAVRAGARTIGLTEMDVVSGAGHDAVYLARVAPTAMIFVPCKDGISHNEIEDAKSEHLEAGCNVLLHAMLARASE
ncbi:MAG: Zn-dependent hydrolase [Alcaligenaceae bacterium]|nr:MAG: Zn-dependent hydrolase [Alcaligenaceae bacterium]